MIQNIQQLRLFVSSFFLVVIFGFTAVGSTSEAMSPKSTFKKKSNADLIATVFPHQYSFSINDHQLIVKTPLPYSRVVQLVKEIKIVHTNFFKIVGSMHPVPQDPNDELVVMIYGSSADYDVYHPMIYNLKSNNGGIYLEGKGILFTYDRTEHDSIYSLTEMVKHEYAHYLIGRYLVSGLWGQAAIYDNHRLTWFDEGFAEFLVGSHAEGIAKRSILVKQIRYHDKSERQNVSQILRSKYGDGFRFYKYSGLFFNYMYENDIDLMRQIIAKIRHTDIDGLDRLLNHIAQDKGINDSYHEFLMNSFTASL